MSLKTIYTLKMRQCWTFQENDPVFDPVVLTSEKFDSTDMGIIKITLSCCTKILFQNR